MTPPVLAAAGLGYAASGRWLVRDGSLALAPGRLTVVVGPNGAGKSTLVKLLSGELKPAAGEVRYASMPAGAVPPWRLACLRAVLPQASRLAFPFTVAEIVRIGQDGIGRGLGRRERDALVAAAMARADVAHLAPRDYQTLSGGEQQRAQFARVLAQVAAGRGIAAAQVLLLDEPTASLDLRHQLALLEEAARLARDGLAVLAVLHDLNLAAAYADELVVMREGAVAARGLPGDVLTDALVRDVFGVDLAVGAVPEGGRPFVLPHRRPAGPPPA